jgi:DNA primase small subunit
MPMLGSTYELQKGINTVPEAVAVFLCCRGMAEIA